MTIYYILKLKGKWKELMWYKDTVGIKHFFPSKVGIRRKIAIMIIKDCNHQANINILSLFWTKCKSFVVFPVNENFVIFFPPGN